MDIEVLRSTLEQVNLAALGVGFLTGFVFSFNPVALAAIPVSLAYVTKAQETRNAVVLGGLFILGMIVTHVLLGLMASLGGLWVQKLLGRKWGLVLGPLLILLGLLWPGWLKLRLPIPAIPIKSRPALSLWGAFVLGIPFSVAVCPFCTPALVIMLGVVAGIGSLLFGVTLLLAFALGRAVPILLGAWAVGWLKNLEILKDFQKTFEVIGGVLLISSGLYMLNAYFVVIPKLAL